MRWVGSLFLIACAKPAPRPVPAAIGNEVTSSSVVVQPDAPIEPVIPPDAPTPSISFATSVTCATCTCSTTAFASVKFTTPRGYPFDGCAVFAKASANLTNIRPNTSVEISVIRTDDRPSQFTVVFVLSVRTPPQINSDTPFHAEANAASPSTRGRDFLSSLETALTVELTAHVVPYTPKANATSTSPISP